MGLGGDILGGCLRQNQNCENESKQCPCSEDPLPLPLEICAQMVMIEHTFNPSTRKAEAGKPLSLRAAWSTE